MQFCARMIPRLEHNDQTGPSSHDDPSPINVRKEATGCMKVPEGRFGTQPSHRLRPLTDRKPCYLQLPLPPRSMIYRRCVRTRKAVTRMRLLFWQERGRDSVVRFACEDDMREELSDVGNLWRMPCCARWVERVKMSCSPAVDNVSYLHPMSVCLVAILSSCVFVSRFFFFLLSEVCVLMFVCWFYV